MSEFKERSNSCGKEKESIQVGKLISQIRILSRYNHIYLSVTFIFDNKI